MDTNQEYGEILADATRLADESKTWADLSNALFHPVDGLLARRIPDPNERAAFRMSDTYGELIKLVKQKMQETGVVPGAESTKSGSFKRLSRDIRKMSSSLSRLEDCISDLVDQVHDLLLHDVIEDEVADMLWDSCGNCYRHVSSAWHRLQDVGRVVAQMKTDRRD
jgi:hypothetical protein